MPKFRQALQILFGIISLSPGVKPIVFTLEVQRVWTLTHNELKRTVVCVNLPIFFATKYSPFLLLHSSQEFGSFSFLSDPRRSSNNDMMVTSQQVFEGVWSVTNIAGTTLAD